MAAKPTNWPYVINLGNSIIGVSVLAMPYCFKQCGLFLGVLLLFGSAYLTHLSCLLLIKGAHSSRKRSYEYLALHTFGPAGKLCVEISIIGLLIGTSVAFFVIIGDLGPTFIAKHLGFEHTWNLRTAVMVFLAVFVALPLSLVKNVESLSNFSAMSIGFYSVFVAEVFVTAFPNLWSGFWVANVVYWRPEGIFKCIPIFSLAFACQTQLFVMYDALSEPSIKRIGDITKNAIGMCASVYLCVGYFGYVAFCHEDISGDILLHFRPTIFSEAVKLGFVLSIAISFPLIIFPLRTSMYTLLFHKQSKNEEWDNDFWTESEHQMSNEIVGAIFIPDLHLKGLTSGILLTTLLIGICVPNIEFVLALTGATMGSMICFIFPAVMFISVMQLSTHHGKSTAQFVLFLGVTILLASTYVTLNSQSQASTPRSFENEQNKPPDFLLQNPPLDNIPPNENIDNVAIADNDANLEDKRQEPPNPQAPDQEEEVNQQDKELKQEIKEDEKKIEEEIKQIVKEEQEQKQREKEQKKQEAQDRQERDAKEVENVQPQEDSKISEKQADMGKKDEQLKEKEEAKQLLHELKEQQKIQEELIEEQKNIIQDLKMHQKEVHDHKEDDMAVKHKDGGNNEETLNLAKAINAQEPVQPLNPQQDFQNKQPENKPQVPAGQPLPQIPESNLGQNVQDLSNKQQQQANQQIHRDSVQQVPHNEGESQQLVQQQQQQGSQQLLHPKSPMLQNQQQQLVNPENNENPQFHNQDAVNQRVVKETLKNSLKVQQDQLNNNVRMYDDNKAYQLVQNFLFNRKPQIGDDGKTPSENDPRLAQLKENLEKIKELKETKEKLNNLLKDPSLLELLKSSEQTQVAMELRELINSISMKDLAPPEKLVLNKDEGVKKNINSVDEKASKLVQDKNVEKFQQQNAPIESKVLKKDIGEDDL